MPMPYELQRRVAVVATSATPGTTTTTLQLAAPGAGIAYRIWSIELAILRGSSATSLVQVELQSPSGTGQALLSVSRAANSMVSFLFPGGLLMATNTAIYTADSSDAASQSAYYGIYYTTEAH